MTDTNRSRQRELADQSLDDFEDADNDMVWNREHTRSLAFLLGGFAIIVAVIVLASLLG